MERMLNTEQALNIFKECYLTDSVQTLRKWIREGRIAATGSQFRQGGYKIKAEDLKEFIEEERPGLLEILHVYHKANNNLPIKVTSFFDQLEDENSDPTATASETTDSCVEKLDFIPERNLSEEQRGVGDLHTIIENLNETVSELMKQQVVIVQPKINKKVEGGAHKAKSKEEFVSFLRKNFWNANSENPKLKGEIKQIFNEETSNCYVLFYDERGLFRDEELKIESGEYEMKTEVNAEEVIIKGSDRKELMRKYFEVVLLPKIKKQEVTLFDYDVNQDVEGHREYIDLNHKT